MRDGRRPASFYWLAAFFALFVVFLYGPTLAILVLSFQGPQGGLTFPMNGVSTFWFAKLWQGLGVVDIWAAFRRSLKLGIVVMVLTVALSFPGGPAPASAFAATACSSTSPWPASRRRRSSFRSASA
jgi:putative spermidine/putrescine transport system permease protein